MGSGLPLLPEVMNEIVERTDGVPLFVEELTKAVIEAGSSDGKSPPPVGQLPS